MTSTKSDDEKRDEVLKRVLQTKPKPHADQKPKKKNDKPKNLKGTKLGFTDEHASGRGTI